MKAVIVDEQQELNWLEIPDPHAHENELLIDIHAAAVNRADLLQRQGKYPPPPGAPDHMGLEVAGIVSAKNTFPADSKWKAGDRVCALLGGGGYATQVAVHQDLLLPAPPSLSLEEAASLPEVFATAYLNLVIEANLVRGETVLIHAGASGVGIAAIQIAKYLGARVVTTVSTEAKEKAVRELGADIVIRRGRDNIGAILDQCETDGHPINVALDCVGGADLGPHLVKMAHGGRWVMIATLGGTETTISLRPLLKRGLRLIGSTLRSRSPKMKARILDELRKRIWPALERGEIRPVIHEIVNIEESAKAHAILEQNQNIGKVVLRVVDSPVVA